MQRSGADDHDPEQPAVAPAPQVHDTATGEPCPRSVRTDGTVSGSGDCVGCGTCLLGSGLV